MPSVLRSALACSFVVVLGLLPAAGCSRQGEGERCDLVKSGSDDCDSGLTCVSKGSLIEGIADRCCPVDGREKDLRCRRGTPMSNTGGSSAGGSSAGGSSAGGGGTTSAEAGTTSSEGGSGAVDAGGSDAGGANTGEGAAGGGSEAGNDGG